MGQWVGGSERSPLGEAQIRSHIDKKRAIHDVKLRLKYPTEIYEHRALMTAPAHARHWRKRNWMKYNLYKTGKMLHSQTHCFRRC